MYAMCTYAHAIIFSGDSGPLCGWRQLYIFKISPLHSDCIENLHMNTLTDPESRTRAAMCLCKRVRENDENRMNEGGKANDFTVQTDC